MTLDRWQSLSLRDQLGHIASEILRANLMKDKDQNIYQQILERAIALVDLSLDDSRWQENPLPLLVLRNELARAYLGETNLDKIYQAL